MSLMSLWSLFLCHVASASLKSFRKWVPITFVASSFALRNCGGPTSLPLSSSTGATSERKRPSRFSRSTMSRATAAEEISVVAYPRTIALVAGSSSMRSHSTMIRPKTDVAEKPDVGSAGSACVLGPTGAESSHPTLLGLTE